MTPSRKASCPAASACTTACCRTARTPGLRSRQQRELKPVKLTGTMAFMFETRYPAARHQHTRRSLDVLEDDYADCWKGLEKRFDPNKP